MVAKRPEMVAKGPKTVAICRQLNIHTNSVGHMTPSVEGGMAPNLGKHIATHLEWHGH